jgi:S-adenosylmethionine decarboxylase
MGAGFGGRYTGRSALLFQATQVIWHEGNQAPGASELQETVVNKTPLTTIAPEVFRKRLLIEGYFGVEVTAQTVQDYFSEITTRLNLRTYGEPIVHKTGGAGKDVNEGFDGFVPLIDSGIYISVWVNPRFLSTIVYTCADFAEDRAINIVKDFFKLSEFEAAIF